MKVEMSRDVVSPQTTLFDFGPSPALSDTGSCSYVTRHDNSDDGILPAFSPIEVSSSESYTERYTDYLARFARARLHYGGDLPSPFCSFDIFRGVTFPEWFDRRNLGVVMRVLVEEKTVTTIGSGRVRRFRGNAGIGCLYEKNRLEDS